MMSLWRRLSVVKGSGSGVLRGTLQNDDRLLLGFGLAAAGARMLVCQDIGNSLRNIRDASMDA